MYFASVKLIRSTNHKILRRILTHSELFGNNCSRLSSSNVLSCHSRRTFVATAVSRSALQEDIMNVFDRKTKRKQRNRTALYPNYEIYDYIKEEVAWRLSDRMSDVKRKFEVALDLGCGRGHIAKHVLQDMVGVLYQSDMAELVLAQSEISPEVETHKIHADEESLPFEKNFFNLVISNLSLHWVNDLPGAFKQVHHVLKDDGCFMGALFGGETLHELRVALQLAEVEREGGISAHVSPFTSAQDLGGLLNRAGFVMLTIDIDEIIVSYPTMMELMYDLKGMGENNCVWSRRSMLHRETIAAAAAIYQEKFGHKDRDGVPAMFQILYFIGWKPDKSQLPAAQRGSAQFSMKDIGQLESLNKDIQGLKENSTLDQRNLEAVNELAKGLDKLKTAGDENGKEKK